MKEKLKIFIAILIGMMLICIIPYASAGYWTKDTAKTIYPRNVYKDEGGSDYWLSFITPGNSCITELHTRTWLNSGRIGSIHTAYRLETADGKKIHETGAVSDGVWNIYKATLNPGTKYYIHVLAMEGDQYRDDAACGYELKIIFADSTIELDSSFTFTLSKTQFAYAAKAIEPKVTVKDSKGISLAQGSDYTVTYENNINAGTATVIVTGVGGYSGKRTETFKIIPAKLSDIKLKKTEYDYSGKAIKPTATVLAKVNGKSVTLKQGKDYTLSYTKNKTAGTASVKATGKGNYKGTVKAAYTIRPVKLSSVTLAESVMVYTGKALTPSVKATAKIQKKNVILTEGTDYTVEYADNTAIGTASVTVKGKGGISGSVRREFRIIPGIPGLSVKSSEAGTAELSATSVKGAVGYEFSYQAAGASQSRVLQTEKKSCKLTDLEDQKEYEFRVRAYAQSGSGEKIYGEYSQLYLITINGGKDISGGKITIGTKGQHYVYSGKAICPSVKVKVGLSTLKEEDYQLSYENNISAGKATVTVRGIGKYSGQLSGTFTIDRAQIIEDEIDIQAGPFPYSGEPIEPMILVMKGKEILKLNTDYQVTYSGNTDAGTATAHVTGIGNYIGKISKNFTISPLDLNECEVSLADGSVYGYTGEEVRPSVLIKSGDHTIPMNEKIYQAEYRNNIEIGKAEATITGIGSLTGSITLEFEIVGWQYPMTECYVCGNDWSEYYAPKASDGRPDHVGIDVNSKSGDPAIYAAASGTIVKTGWNNSNGNYIVISHNMNGQTIYSFYCHLSKITKESGDVSMGEAIGIVGNTGTSSRGEHLHFAVVNAFRAGSYYGYLPAFTGDQTSYSGVTFYNPHYVVANGKLP